MAAPDPGDLVRINFHPQAGRIPLPEGLAVRGVVLADQVKSIDRRARQIEPAGRVPAAFLAHVLERLMSLLTGRMPMEDFDT